MTTVAPRAWHVTNWGRLGWLETGLKVLGMVACAGALWQASGPIGLAADVRTAAFGVVSALTGVACVSIRLRFLAREGIAFVFALANTLAHLAAAATLLHASAPTGWLAVFGGAFVAGEVVKQRFLRTSGYTEAGRTNAQIVRIARGILATYTVFTSLVLVAG